MRLIFYLRHAYTQAPPRAPSPSPHFDRFKAPPRPHDEETMRQTAPFNDAPTIQILSDTHKPFPWEARAVEMNTWTRFGFAPMLFLDLIP